MVSRGRLLFWILFVSFLCSINVSTCVPSLSLSLSPSFCFCLHLFDFIIIIWLPLPFSTKRIQKLIGRRATTKCNELLPAQCGDDQHIHSSNMASLTQIWLQFCMLFVSSHTSHLWIGAPSSAHSIADWTVEWLLPVGLTASYLLCYVSWQRSFQNAWSCNYWCARSQSSHLASIQHRLSHYSVNLFFFLWLCVKRLTCSANAQMLTKWKHVLCLDLDRLRQLIFIQMFGVLKCVEWMAKN